jgi:hypothetical protein
MSPLRVDFLSNALSVFRMPLALGLLIALGFSHSIFAKDGAVPVDAELIIAVDVSWSMDPEEQYLQRQGYIDALRSPQVLAAIQRGPYGKIAMTYVEWAGSKAQHSVVPWMVIDGTDSIEKFIHALQVRPAQRLRRTSLSGAIDFSVQLFSGNGFAGTRQIIDISGDGANNDGRPVNIARDEALAADIVINGLPIILDRPNSFYRDVERLDHYYEDCVIGGPGAFMVAITTREQFTDATKTKLILEIAGYAPYAFAQAEYAIRPASVDRPRMSCLEGERIWNQRWGN